jgi:hypothetical protein
LNTVLSLEDLCDIVEVLRVDRHNEIVAAKLARESET